METKLWLKFDFDKWKDDPEDVDNEDVDFEQGDGLRMRKVFFIILTGYRQNLAIRYSMELENFVAYNEVCFK